MDERTLEARAGHTGDEAASAARNRPGAAGHDARVLARDGPAGVAFRADERARPCRARTRRDRDRRRARRRRGGGDAHRQCDGERTAGAAARRSARRATALCQPDRERSDAVRATSTIAPTSLERRLDAELGAEAMRAAVATLARLRAIIEEEESPMNASPRRARSTNAPSRRRWRRSPARTLPLSGWFCHHYQFAPMTVARHAWMATHVTTAILFVVVAGWHVVMNRKAIVAYLRGAAAGAPGFSREARLAAAIFACGASRRVTPSSTRRASALSHGALARFVGGRFARRGMRRAAGAPPAAAQAGASSPPAPWRSARASPRRRRARRTSRSAARAPRRAAPRRAWRKTRSTRPAAPASRPWR